MIYAWCDVVRPVPIGEASVVVAVSAAHRRDAMRAVEFLIDTLKASVPVWKKVAPHDNIRAWLMQAGGVRRRHVELEGELRVPPAAHPRGCAPASPHARPHPRA